MPFNHLADTPENICSQMRQDHITDSLRFEMGDGTGRLSLNLQDYFSEQNLLLVIDIAKNNVTL